MKISKVITGLSLLLIWNLGIAAPPQSSCSLRARKTTSEALATGDINEMLGVSEVIRLALVKSKDVNPKVDVVELHTDKFWVRYSFNTQGGVMSLGDLTTGLETWNSWLNDYEKTSTGKLPLTLWLTNIKGGLVGEPLIFQLDLTCTPGK